MATSRRSFDHHPPADVFAALTTPETYPSWLVGCQDIRGVDPGWPTPGSAFHHRVGLAGPITVADSTKVLAVSDAQGLVLEVRARPFGRGRVEFDLDELPGGGTRVTLDEVPLGALALAKPVLDPLTRARNDRSLARLEEYLDARSAGADADLDELGSS